MALQHPPGTGSPFATPAFPAVAPTAMSKIPLAGRFLTALLLASSALGASAQSGRETGYFQPRELAVLAPDSLAGVYPAGSAEFGDTLDVGGITGSLVHVEDPGDATTGAKPGEGCAPLTNPDEMVGNVAFVRRGACEFALKVWHAQQADAVAVVIYNDERVPDTDTTVINMGCGACEEVRLPSVFVSRATGLLLLGALDAGAEVVVRLQPATTTAAEPPAPNAGLLALSAPRPNPTPGTAVLALTLGRPDEVTVEALDTLGRRVAVLHEGWLSQGRHTVAFDGRALPAGLYLVRAAGADRSAVTQRLALVR